MKSVTLTPAIAQAGYGISGHIGGIPRRTYYTPDGRTLKAIPDMREYVKKDSAGKITGSGNRDANLDKGWLLEMPKTLKLFCPTCDKWHDTPKEVSLCKKRQESFINLMAAKAKKEETDKTSSLEQQVADLTAIVKKLMEAQQNGEVFQPKSNVSQQVPVGAGIGAAKEGLQ